MKVLAGSDHLGLELKRAILAHLQPGPHDVRDLGCFDDDPVDYPDVALEVASGVATGGAERGILVCGTGIGMAIAANKVPGIRAASVGDPYSAERAMRSNNAQILCLGARVTGESVALMLIDLWLEAEFGHGRSARKVAKINAIDSSSGKSTAESLPISNEGC